MTIARIGMDMRAAGLRTVFVMIPLLAAGCGDSLRCKDGTFKSGGTCLGYDPNDSTAPITTADPPAGRSRDPVPSTVSLTANEPATIFYTLDGSEPGPESPSGRSPVVVPGISEGITLRFHAIDLAGNQESTQTMTFLQDIEGPARLSDFGLAVAGSAVTLTWSTPPDPDFAGVAVARVADLADSLPVPGEIYAPGAVLSSSVQLVFVGTGEEYQETVAPGFVRFIAWPFDDLGNYGAPAAVYADVAVGSLAGLIEVDAGAETFDVLQQPANLVLTGQASHDGAATLTVQLSVENKTTKAFENPKIALRGLSIGTFSNSDGSVDGDPFRNYGPDLLVPGEVVTRTWTITGVLVTSVVELEVELAHHPSLFAANRMRSGGGGADLYDAGTVLVQPRIVNVARGPNSNGSFGTGWATPDGRAFFGGSNHGRIERFDVKSRSLTLGKSVGFEADRKTIMSIVGNGTGNLFATIKLRGVGGQGSVLVLKLDEGLNELGALELDSDSTHARGQSRSALSPDGRTLAVPIRNEIVLVDTVTMREIDADGSTSTVERISTEATDELRALAFSSDGQTLLGVQRDNDNQVVRVRFPNGVGNGYETTLLGGASGRGNDIAVGPDGRMWVASHGNLRVYDPVAETFSPTMYPAGARGVHFVGDDLYVLRNTNNQFSNQLNLVDDTGVIVRTTTIPAVYSHWLAGTR